MLTIMILSVLGIILACPGLYATIAIWIAFNAPSINEAAMDHYTAFE
ncbi:MAG: hypothetical protein M3R24_39370 [Chloroflexota bacterium]|nr:hypothetical protein [Chloroflexota bacterium]